VFITEYYSSDQTKENEKVARMEGRRCSHKVLMSKPERKVPLGRPRGRRSNNIKMDLQ
jgi:hypothetical protein